MVRTFSGIVGITIVTALIAGCPNSVVFPIGTDAAAVSDVVSKATEVAALVGNEDGFGGVLMTGYAEHMPPQIGFNSEADLAEPASSITIRLSNQSDEDGTFHLSYFAHHLGLNDLLQDVNVAAGEDVTVELPCAEIVGLGPLAEPGEPGCHLVNDEAVANTMAVPGFLGQDYTCGDMYEYLLTPDFDDLDKDGDIEELIIISDALEFHMTNGGPLGHMHDINLGMMGSHMGM